MLASVKAFYFLHSVRFGGLPAGGLFDDCLFIQSLNVDDSDISGCENSLPDGCWGKRRMDPGTELSTAKLQTPLSRKSGALPSSQPLLARRKGIGMTPLARLKTSKTSVSGQVKPADVDHRH